MANKSNIPVDENITKAYREKINKYQDLTYEIRDIYEVKRVEIFPFVISAGGLVQRNFIENLQKLSSSATLLKSAQKAVVLGTTRIVRKVIKQ